MGDGDHPDFELLRIKHRIVTKLYTDVYMVHRIRLMGFANPRYIQHYFQNPRWPPELYWIFQSVILYESVSGPKWVKMDKNEPKYAESIICGIQDFLDA